MGIVLYIVLLLMLMTVLVQIGYMLVVKKYDKYCLLLAFITLALFTTVYFIPSYFTNLSNQKALESFDNINELSPEELVKIFINKALVNKDNIAGRYYDRQINEAKAMMTTKASEKFNEQFWSHSSATVADFVPVIIEVQDLSEKSVKVTVKGAAFGTDTKHTFNAVFKLIGRTVGNRTKPSYLIDDIYLKLEF